MPVFQAVLTDMAAFGGAEGAFQLKKERCGGSCIIRAAQMAGIFDAFFICRPREWLRQNHFRPGESPKTKKGRRREPLAFLGRSSRIRRIKRRGV